MTQAVSDARNHAALAAALDPIITIDARGTILSASDSVRRVFGWTSGELVGRNVSTLMPEPHRSAHDGYIAEHLRTGRARVLGQAREIEAVRKDGEQFPIEICVSRVAGGDPGATEQPLFVGIIRDISERKRVERELRLVQDLALSVSNAPNLARALEESLRLICMAAGWDYGEVWVPRRDGTKIAGVAAWSRPGSGVESFAETLHQCQFSRGAGLPGRTWSTGRSVWVGDIASLSRKEFCRPDAAKQAGLRAAATVPILSEQKTIAVLIFFVRTTRLEDLRFLEMIQAAVGPLGTLMQRKKAEDELEAYRHTLELRVEERTSELHASLEKLRMADRLASIGTLAAGLGHDMNNVLLPVRAHLDALKDGQAATRLGRGGRKHVDEIRKSVTYLQQLADGLHFLAMDPEIDNNTLRGAETTDLRKWWSQTGVLITKGVPKHVRVASSIPAGLPHVPVAAHRLTQAVLNLVVNAGEAIPRPTTPNARPGSVRVWAQSDRGGATVRLGVTDNGRGMTDEVKRRACETFFTTKTRGLGTGLGLALVHKVAVAAGGRVEFESEVGKGTTAVMVLNAAQPKTGRSKAAPIASVSVKSGRSGALIRQVLLSGGARVVEKNRSKVVDIWVIDPEETTIDRARKWRSAHPDARLVLFGSPSGRFARGWSALNPLIVTHRDDFDAMRSVLGSALATR